MKHRAHTFKYKIRNFPAPRGERKFRTLLAGCAGEGRNFSALRLQSCNSAAPKRANNKIGFGHPYLDAYVARDSKGGFSEGGQRHGKVRRGRAARSKTPRSNSVPSTWHITRKLTQTGTSGAASSKLWSFHLWDLCSPAAVAIRNSIVVDKFALLTLLLRYFIWYAHTNWKVYNWSFKHSRNSANVFTACHI